MDKNEIRKMIDKIQEERNIKSFFYNVTGSHLYGFNSSMSDIDVRGSHILNNKDYFKIGENTHIIEINQDSINDKYFNWRNVDFKSNSLKKLGILLYKSNYNVIENILCGDQILCNYPAHLKKLVKIVQNNLPLNTVSTYIGMAKNNYKKYLEPKSDSYEPFPKKFLYVIKGLLGAEYLIENKDIKANVSGLARELDKGVQLVERLVELKVRTDNIRIPKDLEKRANKFIDNELRHLKRLPEESFNREEWREKINSWMIDMRKDLCSKHATKGDSI
jgi:hypothetical protein